MSKPHDLISDQGQPRIRVTDAWLLSVAPRDRQKAAAMGQDAWQRLKRKEKPEHE